MFIWKKSEEIVNVSSVAMELKLYNQLEELVINKNHFYSYKMH